jgi:hypothetical protein
MADVLGFMRKAFPFISAAASFGGAPAVLAAGLVGKALGVQSPDPTPEGISGAVTTALQKDPQAAVALQKAEDDFKVQMAQLQVNLDDLTVQDRSSARQMQVQTRSWMPGVLAAGAVGMLAGCIYLVAFRTLPPSGHDAVILLLGTVVGMCKDVYGYVFGSSAGSDRKTELMAQKQ